MPPRLTCGNYYGETLRRRTVAGVVLTETRYAPHSRLPRHSHEHAYFCLVRRGGYVETYGGLWWDDRTGPSVGLRGAPPVALGPDAPAAIERLYRAVAPRGYVERLQ